MDRWVPDDRSAIKSFWSPHSRRDFSGLWVKSCWGKTGPLEALGPFPAGPQSRWLGTTQGDEGLERTGWVGVVSAYSLPGPSGRCGSCSGFSVKRQRDFMNISLGKQCGGRETSGGALQGAGSPRRKQGCEIRRWYEGLPAPTAEGSSLPVTHWLGSSAPVLGTQTCRGGSCEGGSWVSSLVPPHHGSLGPLSPPRPVAGSELLREKTWGLNFQMRPQTRARLGRGAP